MQRVACVGVFSLVLCACCSAAQPPRAAQTAPASKRSTANAGGKQPDGQSSLSSAAWKVLRDGLEDKKAANRVAALVALGDLGRIPGGVRLVEQSLDDKDGDVRKQAALALGAMRARVAIPRLRAALEDKDAGVAFAAAQSLCALGDRAGRSLLMQVLAGERPATDGLLDSEMREVHHRLQNPKGLMAMGAEKGAGALLGPFSFGIPVAKQMLASPASSERALTVALLAHDPDPATLAMLKKALWDKDWTVREAGARAAGGMRQRDFMPLLAPLLEDAKPPVRYSAAVAILRLSSARRGATQSEPVQRAAIR